MRCQQLSVHYQSSYACQSFILNYIRSAYSLNIHHITLEKNGDLILPWKQQWVCLLWQFCKKDKLLRKREPVQIHSLRSSSEKQMFHSDTFSVGLSKVNYLVWLCEVCDLDLCVFSPITWSHKTPFNQLCNNNTLQVICAAVSLVKFIFSWNALLYTSVHISENCLVNALLGVFLVVSTCLVCFTVLWFLQI